MYDEIQLMIKHHAINYYKQKLFSVVQLLRHIHTLNDLTTVNITTPAIKQLLPETQCTGVIGSQKRIGS